LNSFHCDWFRLLVDNGKEFIATIVVQLLMSMNPHCAIINGHPRTPSDQGSVENANKLVQRVLKSICCENRHKIGGEVNWTKLLGRVMSVCNSHSDCRASSVSAYEAVFGQKYHPQLKCTMSELRKCRTISQRLMVSPDDRLEVYVREHDIVDVALPSDVQQGVSAEDSDDDNEEEGLEIDEDAFPELDDDDVELPLSDTFNPDDDGSAPATTSFPPFPTSSLFRARAESAVDDGDDGDDESGLLEDDDMDVARDGVNPAPEQGLIGGTVCRLTYDSPGSPPPNVAAPTVVQAVVESALSADPAYNRTSLVPDSVATMLTVPQAWERGTIARLETSLSDRRVYNFLWPRLTCRHCCFQNGNVLIQVGDDAYLDSITNTTNWYEGLFVSSFAQMTAHYAHTVLSSNNRNGVVLPTTLLHVTFPRGALTPELCKALPPTTTTVVSVLHDASHFSVLEVDVLNKKVVVFDGLNRELTTWLHHVYAALKRCMLCALDVVPRAEAYVVKQQVKRGRDRQPKSSVEGMSLILGSDTWRFTRGHFLTQTDGVNCGPIACAKILELFGVADYENLRIEHEFNGLRKMVRDFWNRCLRASEQEVLVRVVERTRPRSSQLHDSGVPNPEVAAAAAASAEGEIDLHQFCFCYCDAPGMVLVQMECCKQTVHRVCLDGALSVNSKCPYCRAVIVDLVAIQELEEVNRSDVLSVRVPTEPLQSPLQQNGIPSSLSIAWNDQTHGKKMPPKNLAAINTDTVNNESLHAAKMPPESMGAANTDAKMPPENMLAVNAQILNNDLGVLQGKNLDKTPLRHADVMRSDSQERKRKAQLKQATRMMKQQGQDVTSRGAAPGAVVTVKVDYRAVSHAVGIVGIIYKLGPGGGARVATEYGLLSSGSKLGVWYIACDQYKVQYAANTDANIPPELRGVRNAILGGTYNINNSADKVSIQQAHQYVTQAISPCKKSKCGCANGNCRTGFCGCIKKNFKCTNACSCNGGCAANLNNGK